MSVESALTEENTASAPRRLLSGRLDLEFAADADARTYLRRQYAGYPFHVCRVQFQDRDIPDLATIYIQSCSGGVYEDDRLDFDLAVREHAQVHVSTQSATIVHTMPTGSAEQRVRIECGVGSYLEYLPDPQILFPGSSFRSAIRVRLCGNAVALTSDSFLRHDPTGEDVMFSAYSTEIVIENSAGEALAIDRMKIDGRFQPSRPGILGCFGAQGTLLVACLHPLPSATFDELLKVRLADGEAAIGVTELPQNTGMLVRVLAVDGAALKRVMQMVWSAARLALKGSRPMERRK